MSTLVVVTAVLAGISTIILAKALYTVRRAAINEGLGEDIIDPADDQRYIVNGSVATRWLVVTFLVAVSAVTALFGLWSGLRGGVDDKWSLLIIVVGQLFAWGFAPLLRHENIRARAEHRRYLELYTDQTDR